jgi:hypothetical protein
MEELRVGHRLAEDLVDGLVRRNRFPKIVAGQAREPALVTAFEGRRALVGLGNVADQRLVLGSPVQMIEVPPWRLGSALYPTRLTRHRHSSLLVLGPWPNAAEAAL